MIKQLNVNNVFLNGVLEKDVYMRKLWETNNKKLICQLHKAIYGLK